MNYILILTKLLWVLPPLNEQTFAFYAGELGLVLTTVCSLGIMQAQAKNDDRPEWYYFVIVWGISVGAALMFSRPFIYQNHADIPPAASWFRFAFGMERMVVMINYYRTRHGHAIQLSEAWTLRLNAILGTITVGFIIIVFGGGLLQLNKEQAMTPFQEQSGQILRQNTGRIIGISEELKQRAETDSVEKANLKAELAATKMQLSKTTAQLSDLTDIVISLKRAINRLGATVERSRRTIIAPGAIQAPTFDRKGRSTWVEEIKTSGDSLYYAHQKPDRP